MNLYEISVLMPNGDTRWCRIQAFDYHNACCNLLRFAIDQGGRAERIEHLRGDGWPMPAAGTFHVKPTTPGDPA